MACHLPGTSGFFSFDPLVEVEILTVILYGPVFHECPGYRVVSFVMTTIVANGCNRIFIRVLRWEERQSGRGGSVIRKIERYFWELFL